MERVKFSITLDGDLKEYLNQKSETLGVTTNKLIERILFKSKWQEEESVKNKTSE